MRDLTPYFCPCLAPLAQVQLRDNTGAHRLIDWRGTRCGCERERTSIFDRAIVRGDGAQTMRGRRRRRRRRRDGAGPAHDAARRGRARIVRAGRRRRALHRWQRARGGRAAAGRRRGPRAALRGAEWVWWWWPVLGQHGAAAAAAVHRDRAAQRAATRCAAAATCAPWCRGRVTAAGTNSFISSAVDHRSNHHPQL